MKSFTIHKLDEETAKLLEARAQRENSSINRVVKRLLRSALGLDDRQVTDHRGEPEVAALVSSVIRGC